MMLYWLKRRLWRGRSRSWLIDVERKRRLLVKVAALFGKAGSWIDTTWYLENPRTTLYCGMLDVLRHHVSFSATRKHQSV